VSVPCRAPKSAGEEAINSLNKAFEDDPDLVLKRDRDVRKQASPSPIISLDERLAAVENALLALTTTLTKLLSEKKQNILND